MTDISSRHPELGDDESLVVDLTESAEHAEHALEHAPGHAEPVVDPDRPVVLFDAEEALPPDPRVTETRAMDLAELAVEVTAPPDAPVETVMPRRRRRRADLDRPRYAEDPDPAAVDAADHEVTTVLARPVVESSADADAQTGIAPDAESDPEAETVIDPRIEERRAGVGAERRRRLGRRLAGFAGLMLLGAGAVVAVRSPLLDVDHIDIVGSDQLTAAQLERRTGLGVGDPILFVDPATIEARLRRDPRFVRVAVQRHLPGSISVRVTDRRAIAVVDGPTRSLVVGEDGIVIAEANGDELVRHAQVEQDPTTEVGRRLPRRLAAAVDVMGSLSYDIAVQIQRMSITPDGELVFDLGEDRTVLFGTVEDADRKLLAIRTMLGPQVDLRGMCRLDVRVPSAPTLRRAPDCDPPPPPTTAQPATDPAAVDPAAAATDPAATTDPAAPPTDPAAPPTDPAAPAVDPTAGASATTTPGVAPST